MTASVNATKEGVFFFFSCIEQRRLHLDEGEFLLIVAM
jgi:hypothetical protein